MRHLRHDLLIAVCVDGLTALPIAGQPTTIAPSSIASLVPGIDSIVLRYMQEAHVPGLVYGIVSGGRVEHIGTMGVQDLETRRAVTERTLFRIASMSKAFTALAILE